MRCIGLLGMLNPHNSGLSQKNWFFTESWGGEVNGLYPFGENAFAVHFGIQVLKLHPRATSGIVVLPPNGRMHVLQGSSVYHFRRFSTVFSMFLQRSVQFALTSSKKNAITRLPQLKHKKNVATIYCADNYNESSIIFRCVMFRISLRFFLVR